MELLFKIKNDYMNRPQSSLLPIPDCIHSIVPLRNPVTNVQYCISWKLNNVNTVINLKIILTRLSTSRFILQNYPHFSIFSQPPFHLLVLIIFFYSLTLNHNLYDCIYPWRHVNIMLSPIWRTFPAFTKKTALKIKTKQNNVNSKGKLINREHYQQQTNVKFSLTFTKPRKENKLSIYSVAILTHAATSRGEIWNYKE